MSLDYFIDSCIIALAVATTVESRLYELILNYILPRLDWGIKRNLYCATCVGFWVGGVYFLHEQLAFGGFNALWGAFTVAGVAHTIQLIWQRIEGDTNEYV